MKSIILIIMGIVIGIGAVFAILLSAEVYEELKPHPCLVLWDNYVGERLTTVNETGDMSLLFSEEFLEFGELDCMHRVYEWLPADHQDVEFFRELGL